MRYRYQIILIGTDQDSLFDRLKTAVSSCAAAVGIPIHSFEFIGSENFYALYKQKQPSFAFYGGDGDGAHKDIDIAKILVKAGEPVLPIYYCHGKFDEEIPICLHSQNGVCFHSYSVERMANLAFESFKLMRNSRKLFISYKRTEASNAASQLFHAFLERNYDVFLDTYSIDGAVNFQEELWNRMTDCEVVLQLHTEHFTDSHWCCQEIEEANMRKIGVVKVLWPNVHLTDDSLICSVIHLTNDDYMNPTALIGDPKLNDSTVCTILDHVESMRARNLAARQDCLITEFISSADRVGRKIVRHPNYLHEEIGDKINIYVPIVGVPHSTDYFDSLDFKDALSTGRIANIYLLYDNIRIRKYWQEHLEWLDQYLEVKSIKSIDFSKWMEK